MWLTDRSIFVNAFKMNKLKIAEHLNQQTNLFPRFLLHSSLKFIVKRNSFCVREDPRSFLFYYKVTSYKHLVMYICIPLRSFVHCIHKNIIFLVWISSLQSHNLVNGFCTFSQPTVLYTLFLNTFGKKLFEDDFWIFKYTTLLCSIIPMCVFFLFFNLKFMSSFWFYTLYSCQRKIEFLFMSMFTSSVVKIDNLCCF